MLVGPIIDAEATSTGGGYYKLATDGGVVASGDVKFWGSIQQLLDDNYGGVSAVDWLSVQVVGIVPTPTGLGYWPVAADGEVFAFGYAWFVGSIPGVLPAGAGLAAPINSMVTYGSGYLTAACSTAPTSLSKGPSGRTRHRARFWLSPHYRNRRASSGLSLAERPRSGAPEVESLSVRSVWVADTAEIRLWPDGSET